MGRQMLSAAIAAVALAIGASASGATAADSSPAAPAEPAADAAAVAKGKQLYTLNCSHCHGPNMVNPGTVAFDLRQFPADQPDRFKTSVLNGKGAMPAWGGILSDADIELLWSYVRSANP
jgi:mono/diheme cytochrome c family protein